MAAARSPGGARGGRAGVGGGEEAPGAADERADADARCARRGGAASSDPVACRDHLGPGVHGAGVGVAGTGGEGRFDGGGGEIVHGPIVGPAADPAATATRLSSR